MSERNEKDQLNQEQILNDQLEQEHNESESINLAKALQEQQEPSPNESIHTDTAQPVAAKSGAALIVPWVITAIAVAALIFVLVRTPSDGGLNETVGMMEGATFSNADLYAEMTKSMPLEQQANVLDSLMTLKLIDLEAAKAGVTVSDTDMQSELDKVKTNFGSDEEFAAALEQYGMTLDSLKEQIGTQVKLRNIFEKQNPATEDELKAYYETNKESFATTPKEVQASHILLETQEEAEAVLAELKAGKDFATLAKEKSLDPGSKDEGGVLPLFGRGEMNSGFETAAFAMAKGELSEVVEAESGFHIIKVTDIVEAVIPAYDEVKADVKLAYFDVKLGTEGEAWLEKVKEERNYKNLLIEEPDATASESPAAIESSSPAAQ